MNINKVAKEVLKKEAETIYNLIPKIDQNFKKLVELILNTKGKVIFTGMGKSGLIARKIASTLSSTGIPSFFIHPAEALHGDIGMVSSGDIIIVISNRGETKEVLDMVNQVKKIGVKIAGILGTKDSSLARESDIVLNCKVEEEADYLNLIPTCSSVATLALGDALTVALMKARRFKKEDFAFYHPGGTAGKLLLKVEDLMHTGERNPVIPLNKFVQDALVTITTKRLGAVSIVNEKGEIVGIITDGDVRRLLQRTHDFLPRLFLTEVREVMIKNPKTIYPHQMATEAVELMELNAITVLPVIDKKRRPIGMIHLHDLVKAGLTFENQG